MDDIPYGYCHCGCGEKAKIAQKTRTEAGWEKGKPLRFIFNYHRREANPFEFVDCAYETPCKLWRGNIDKDGYGRITRTDGQFLVHRIAYVDSYGEIPPRHDVHHKCTQKACFEPTHLLAIDRSEHQRHHKSPSVKRRKEPRSISFLCKHGHILDGSSTWHGNTQRFCKTCRRLQKRAYREKAKIRQ